MFARPLSILIVGLAAFCPALCGSADADHSASSAPCERSSHSQHDSCDVDSCFCSSPFAATLNAASGFVGLTLSVDLTPAGIPVCPGVSGIPLFQPAIASPPAHAQRPLPLLI